MGARWQELPIIPYVDFSMFEAQFQVIVDGLVRDLAEQGEIRHANLLLLGAFERSLLNLGLSPSSTTAARGRISRALEATETSILLLPASGTS